MQSSLGASAYHESDRQCVEGLPEEREEADV